jgi:segregation and condensation protein B
MDRPLRLVAANPLDQLARTLEALLVVASQPLSLEELSEASGEDAERIEMALGLLGERFQEGRSGIVLERVAGGWAFRASRDAAEACARLFERPVERGLSAAALETLAVIAYKQPITAAEITEIRGVNTSGVIGTLLERGLVKISGRRQVVGRPFLYSTTREFLDRFGLRDLNDLPKVEDMATALGFEVPAGIATDATHTLPADEPATAEDVAVMTGDQDGYEGEER